MSDWYFSEDDSRLIRPERSVQLTRKAAAVLAVLQQKRGEVVSVETFLKEVWPGTHVTPDLIREYIHDLRKALNDDAQNPRFIETVRGKGFRLIGDIAPASTELASALPGPGPASLPTLAVLKPDQTCDPALDAMSSEVASELIHQLSRYHYLGVIARTRNFTSSDLNDIRAFASDINANYVLETNYSRLGEKIRARVQLVDALSGQTLWGTRLDLSEDDPTATVDEISTTIVMALTGWQGELHRAEYKAVARKRDGPSNAFEHFILGCDLEMQLDADCLLRSLAHLEQAVQRDPTFARAWLVYALELRWAYSLMPSRDRALLEKSQAAFQTAFKLAPTDPVNLALMAMNTARVGNLSGALEMLRRAEAGMQGDSDAMVCIATAKAMLTDDAEGACEIFDTVMHRNTASPSWFYFVETGIAFMVGDFRRCVASSRSGPLEISALAFRCLSLAMLGENDAALAAEAELYAAFPHFEFGRFADNLPIADVARRREYDAAVVRLASLSKMAQTVSC